MLLILFAACIGAPIHHEETGVVNAEPCGTGIALDCCLYDIDEDGYCADDPSDPEYDCDDYNMEIHPNAPEECNGIDDNCIDGIDEGCTKH